MCVDFNINIHCRGKVVTAHKTNHYINLLVAYTEKCNVLIQGDFYRIKNLSQ